MAKEIYARATVGGKVFLELPTLHSNREQFTRTLSSIGDVGHVVSLPRDLKSIQRISDKRILDVIKEVEEAAKGRFGAEYQITEFVLIGD